MLAAARASLVATMWSSLRSRAGEALVEGAPLALRINIVAIAVTSLPGPLRRFF